MTIEIYEVISYCNASAIVIVEQRTENSRVGGSYPRLGTTTSLYNWKNFKGEILMQIDQVEWLRRENYFLREQNKILKNELSETKKYLEEILTKFKDVNKGN